MSSANVFTEKSRKLMTRFAGISRAGSRLKAHSRSSATDLLPPDGSVRKSSPQDSGTYTQCVRLTLVVLPLVVGSHFGWYTISVSIPSSAILVLVPSCVLLLLFTHSYRVVYLHADGATSCRSFGSRNPFISIERGSMSVCEDDGEMVERAVSVNWEGRR